MGRLKDEVAAMRERLADLESNLDERVRLTVQAMQIANGDYLGKSADEIRATAVALAQGYEFIDGRTPDYIAARFDHLAEQATQDPVRVALMTRTH